MIVDEYDKPITKYLSNPEKAEEMLEELVEFY